MLNLKQSVDNETQQWVLKKLFNLDAIGKVFCFKAKMSATGPGAISNVIWKFYNNITCKLLCAWWKQCWLLSSHHQHGNVLELSCSTRKELGIILNRPIYLTSTLYKIVMGQSSSQTRKHYLNDPEIWSQIFGSLKKRLETHRRILNIIENTWPYNMQTDTAQRRKSSLWIMEELIYDIKDI